MTQNRRKTSNFKNGSHSFKSKWFYDIVYDNIYDIFTVVYDTALCLYRKELLSLLAMSNSWGIR